MAFGHSSWTKAATSSKAEQSKTCSVRLHVELNLTLPGFQAIQATIPSPFTANPQVGVVILLHAIKFVGTGCRLSEIIHGQGTEFLPVALNENKYQEYAG